MWWIFQEAERLFSILPPPPQIMLLSGRLGELLCKRGNTSCSLSYVEDSSTEPNPNEWSRREMIQTWRKLWCELPPNCSWHSVRNRDLPEVFLHIFPLEVLPASRSGNINCTRGVYWFSLEIPAPNGSGTLWAAFSGVSSAPDWSNASTKFLFQAPGSSALPTGCPRARNALKTTNHPTPPVPTGVKHTQSWQTLFFFLQDQDLCVPAEGVTHRILLPLLAFLSTFFFILLRNFWMANHCLGDAEQQENNFRATEHSQKRSPNVLKAPFLNHNFLKSKKFPAGKNFSWL